MSEITESITDEMPKREPQVLNILQWPSALLKEASKPILSDIKNDQNLQWLLDDMEATLHRAQALGLAAVQVGVPLRALVVLGDDGEVRKVINPVLRKVSAETVRKKEGCLSFMGLFIDVKRPVTCEVTYYDENGDLVNLEAGHQLGRAIQHEIDHLDGKVFLDRIPMLERNAALNKNKVARRRMKKMISKLQK